MMLLIIGSESIFFISLMLAYVSFSKSGHLQSSSKAMLDIKATGGFTALLVASSFTYWMSERYYRKGEQGKLKVWLMLTIILGSIFLFGQGHEYYTLLNKEVTFSSGSFGTTFYTLTGFHALHVIIGLIMLIILFILTVKGFFERKSTLLSTIGIYWHFVDAVWLAVFTLIYVIPYL